MEQAKRWAEEEEEVEAVEWKDVLAKVDRRRKLRERVRRSSDQTHQMTSFYDSILMKKLVLPEHENSAVSK